MKKSSKLRLFALAMTLAVALAGCGSNVASADEDDQQAGNEAESTQGIDWPQKAVTVVVPASAGGDTDSYARIFGQYLEQELGESVVISNVGGAGGTVGTRQVKDAEPDGNMILFYHGSALLNTIMGLADFDVRTDMQIADIPIKDNTQMLFADAKKFKSLQDVIDQCKAEPESVVFGRETGTQAHLVALALEDARREIQSGRYCRRILKSHCGPDGWPDRCVLYDLRQRPGLYCFGRYCAVGRFLRRAHGCCSGCSHLPGTGVGSGV